MVIERWTIYWANLDPAHGSEQVGTRPVLVISADNVNVLNQVSILPLTSIKSPQRRIRRNEAAVTQQDTGLDRDSIVLAHQIRTLDKTRLESIAGKITEENAKAAILDAVKVQLGF